MPQAPPLNLKSPQRVTHKNEQFLQEKKEVEDNREPETDLKPGEEHLQSPKAERGDDERTQNR
jgi:hypothetical protein